MESPEGGHSHFSPHWVTIHDHLKNVHVIKSVRQTRNLLVLVFTFITKQSFLFITKVLNKHGQKKADICKLCAFNRRLNNPITNAHVRGRHQAGNSQESGLYHKCTIFLFHIKMINTRKAKTVSVGVLH